MRSNATYNRLFATYYDQINTHKNYPAETDTLINLICQATSESRPRILDVGCGTGTHAALLAERGHDVTAIDLSPEMIRVAEAKTANVAFRCGDISDLSERNFRFCYSLFNVINCLDSINVLITFLRSIWERLEEPGRLLVEGWNPLAVIVEPPKVVERTYQLEKGHIIRRVVPIPDFFHQRLDLEYHLTVENCAERKRAERFCIIHRLTLFTPLEIEYALTQAGFKKVQVHTALPEMAPATIADRMLAFTADK